MTRSVEVAIIGAGSSGLSALSQVRPRTTDFVLINGGHLGTTCARVGCMPSKAAIQIGDDYHRRALFELQGIEGADELSLDRVEAMEQVRDLRDDFVGRVTSNSTDKMPPEKVIDGYAKFTGPNTLEVNGETIEAKRIIIAAGGRPIMPEAWRAFGDKVLTTDEFFEQESFPDRMAVIGLGVIGLELGQTLARYGVKVTGVEATGLLAHLSDPVADKAALAAFSREMDIWMDSTAELSASGDSIKVTAGDKQVEVDQVLVSIGRKPNLDTLNLEALGVDLDANGLPPFNPNTMQIGDLPVYIAGDINMDLPILHEAGDEGKIAGYNATQDQPKAFARRTPLAIVFSDPNIVTVGANYNELDEDRIVIGEMPMQPVGRALIMGQNSGILRVYANKSDGTLLGASFVGARAEHLGHLTAWSIQQGMTVLDMLRMPFYHPVIEEALQAALRDALGKLDMDLPDMPEYKAL